MVGKMKLSLISRLALLGGGLIALLWVAVLLWAGFTLPLSLRLPVPSLDGKYFAYFNPVEATGLGQEPSHDLIVSVPHGQLVARLRVGAGTIHWSNAGHLAIVNEGRTEAMLIANSGGRFITLSRIMLSQGAEPRWSRDGNKLACVRPGPAGDEVAIYDIQQPQALVVPFPPGFHLHQSKLLFWSPGSEYLFLLNEEGPDVVLEKVGVLDGTVQSLAKGLASANATRYALPQVSPDGTTIYLPPPWNCVLDVETRETLWALPADAEVLRSPWSADGRQLFYFRQQDPSAIRAHDLSGASDQVVVAGVQPSGFFTADGRSYFYRRLFPSGPALSWREWLEKSWGWQKVDLVTQSTQALGRLELSPWQQTLEGSILARQDDYTRARFGLYDPDGGVLEEYVFPTAQEDLSRQIKAHRLVLLTVALYGLLVLAVFWRRPTDAPARAFYVLALVLVALFAGQFLLSSLSHFRLPSPFPATSGESLGLDWWRITPLSPLLLWKAGLVVTLLWALLPVALLHLALVFPERDRFTVGSFAFRVGLYGVALLPLLGMLVADSVPGLVKVPLWGFLIPGGVAVAAVWSVSIVHSYRRPPNPRTRDQVRWLTVALGLAAGGGVLLLLERSLAGLLAGQGSRRLLEAARAGTLTLPCWAGPSALAYAVAARKPYSLRLLIRRSIRHAFSALPALVVFLLLWGGLSWVTSGGFVSLSLPVVAIAVLVTVLVTMPFRGRLRSFVDRTFDRLRYDFRERLVDFARGLPQLVDRQTLVSRLGDTLPAAMGTRHLYLFALDRHAKKLRLTPGKGDLSSDVREVEFDAAEPLCQYLLDQERPFEADVSPFSPELISIFRTAADRLGKLQAGVILGLKRRHELLGLLIMGVKTAGEFYNAEELELLKVVASEAAVGLENIDLFEEVARDRILRRELEDASEVQAQLLPTVVPRLSTGQLAGRCVLARSARGDYYDFLELPGGKVGLAIGDVCGRGMSASLLMATVQGLLRTQAPTAQDLRELARRINRHLYASTGGSKFCTLFYGVYEDVKRRLEYLSAGHSPPLVLTAGGARYLDPTGLPLGLFPEVSHGPRFESLEPGTLLVLYSDGIIEARNSRGETYGMHRFVSAVSRAREADAERIVARVLGDVHDFTAGVLMEDDQTLVVLKVEPVPGSRV
jgi:serine phosphatase RsbU (regulator of sigma subunit)